MPPLVSESVRVTPRSRAEWRRWLARNHARASGIWLVYYKKATGKPTVGYDEAVEEALCFGWIDGKVKSLGDEQYMQVFTPRQAKSGWSKPNKERVAHLLEQGLMEPAGLAVVETARANGSWELLDGSESLEVPDDLIRALAARPAAAKNFAGFSESARKSFLRRVYGAKRPETRARRIAEIVDMAANNQYRYPF